MANTISRSGNSIRGRRPRTDVDMMDAIRSSWEDLVNDRLPPPLPPRWWSIPTPVTTPGVVVAADEDATACLFNPRIRLMGDDELLLAAAARAEAKAVKAAAALTLSSIKLSAIFSGILDTNALNTQSINAMCPLP
jgi:hypothetical protein